jgi:xanthine dehydrogenase accessory factor
MKRATLDRLNADRTEMRPVALVTETASGGQWLVYADDASAGLPDDVLREARAALADDRSATLELNGKSYFIQVHNPPLRLFIVGAVHITQALARIAVLAGYAVTVIDPRRAFAEPERFPGLEVSNDWPDDVLGAAAPDRRTAIVTLSHDPKIDDPALETVLKSEVFYIGSLGSNRTHGKRLARLEKKGFSAAEMARIHGPVGLDIGSKSPAEIAISIMAEITQARRAHGGVAS